jgi:hypothetical protein
MTDFTLLDESNKKLGIHDDLAIPKNKILVVVYSPPKVGSTSIVVSLRIFAALHVTVIHLHNEKMMQVLHNIDPSITILDIINYNANQLGKSVFVIDVYRTPIEHYMSIFFESISTLHFNNSPININKYGIDRIARRFNNVYPFMEIEDYFFSIFHQQEHQVNNDTHFDIDNKYIKLVNGNVTFVKLRLADSHEWSSILTNLLSWKVLIVPDYETVKKPFGPLYNRFKESYRLPRNYFDKMAACPSLKYYLSEKERLDYINVWSNKVTDEYESFYTPEQYKFYIEVSCENKFLSDIQADHYIDEGCICINCRKKRQFLIYKILSGQSYSNVFVRHIVEEPLEKRQQQQQQVKPIRKTMNMFHQKIF